MKLIDKDAVIAEIKSRIDTNETCQKISGGHEFYRGAIDEAKEILSLIDTLEVKEVDLEKLGEIARHLIAVRDHIEDMRLDKEEWFMLEKIGYPERFKAEKGEEV